jgi:hypothetical protein
VAAKPNAIASGRPVVRSSALAFLLVAGLGAVEDSRELPEPLRPDPAPVAVGGGSALALGVEAPFVLLPGAALAGADHAVELHPKAMAGLGWESNPLADAAGSPADAFARLIAGCDLRLAAGDGSRLEAAAEIDARRWLGTPQLDFVGGGGRIAWTTRRPDRWWRAGAACERDSSTLAASAATVAWNRWQAGAAAGGDGRGWAWDGSLVGTLTDYREDAADFIADDHDNRRLDLALAGRRLGWGGGELGVAGGAGAVAYPHGDDFNDGRGAWLTGRWRHLAADRAWLTAEAGAEGWRFADRTAGDPANDDAAVWVPRAGLRFTWNPEPLSGLDAGLASRLEEGSDANAARVLAADLAGRLRLRDRTAAYVQLVLARRADTGARPGQAAELRINRAGELGLVYELRDGYALRLRLAGEDSEARVGESWTTWRAALELAAAL